MKEENLLEKLYSNEICLAEYFPLNISYNNNKRKELIKREEQLTFNFRCKTAKKLVELDNAISTLTFEDTDKAYLKGLCFGIKLMSKIKVGDTYGRNNRIL